jgi:hypothetical protein
MRRKSALAGLAVAACFAVGTMAHAQNRAQTAPDQSQDQTVFLSSPLADYSPAAVQGPLGNVAPSLLSNQTRTLIGNRNPLRDLQMTAAIAPGIDLTAGSGADLTGRFNGYDQGANSANDGLFLTSAVAPYSAAVSGGNFVGVTVALASDLHFSVGHSALSAKRSAFDAPLFSSLTQPYGLRSALYGHSADATFANVDWNFSSWGGLGLNASSTVAQNSLMASVDASRAALSKVSSNSVGASAHVGLGDGWVTTVSYTQGVTQLDLRPTNLLGANLDTRAYSVSVAKHGLFADNDSLGLAVSRPIEDFAGRLNVAPIDSAGGLTGASPFLPFGAKPETDLELGYVTSFFNGALNLQANAAYQMNVEGQNGTNSLTVLSRAKINF